MDRLGNSSTIVGLDQYITSDKIILQDFRSRHREGEDRLGNNHREIITLSVDGRNYLLKISVYDKFR